MEKAEYLFKTLANLLWGDWLLAALLGLGALFWMWVAAFLGMATKFGEIVMGITYHGYDEKGDIAGGPMYYIEHGMGWKGAGIFVAVMLFIQNAGGTLIQSNTISNVVNEAFRAPFLVTGTVMAAVLHSSAEVDHPVRQGLYGVIEVFIDTILISSATGFTILITGANGFHGNASTLAAAAFKHVLPGMEYVIYISLILFASTSLMSQWYFGHVSLTYLKRPGLAVAYRLLFPVIIIVGSLGSIDMVWYIQDCALGLLILPNIAALFLLGPQVRRAVKEFMNPENGYLNGEKENT